MCWVGLKEDRHISKGDVKVFKMVLREPKSWSWLHKEYQIQYFSPFYWGTYHIGETTRIEGIIPKIEKRKNCFGDDYDLYKITEGIHCYSMDCGFEEVSRDIRVYTTKNPPGWGGKDWSLTLNYYHKNDTKRENVCEIAMLECTIPAGTVYWENSKGEIVAERLRIEREIPIT
jgi:hypothetical protein